ncbi:MAG: inositol monophosphatase family protein [Nitrososphaerales archaeon]
MTRTFQVDWISVFRRAATSGKRAILRNYNFENRVKVVKRGVGGDLTLEIDEVSEHAIYESLKRDLGEDLFVFVSEELGEIKPQKGSEPLPVVICDPLDGSHNAQVGIPFFAVSLSVIVGTAKTQTLPRTFGNVGAGFVLSVKTNDEYFARKGTGAFHDGVKLKPRTWAPPRAETLLVETGDVDFLREKLISNLSKKEVYKIRVLGSAALSYCLLADGSADGLIFAQPGGGARTIDSPAGYLIAREAGCVFADLSGKYLYIDRVEVGFHSKIDLIGASNSKMLTRLKRSVHLP